MVGISRDTDSGTSTHRINLLERFLRVDFELGHQQSKIGSLVAALESGHVRTQPRYRRGDLGLGLGEGPVCSLLRVRAAAAA